ncbi:MAG: PepSY domain-containing protein [Hyphomicrobiaceae bacterium]
MTFKTRIAAALLVTVAVATLGSGKGLADSKKRLNQDEVREAVTSGRIRPLEEVLAAAAKVVPGQVIKVEIERKRGVLIYEIKVIAGQGRVREVEIDAATLEVLEVE